MIIGIGTDIVNIKRIELLLDNYKERFINRILSKKEIEVFFYIPKIKKAKYIAKRFAGKEAFAKALGFGIGKNIAFNEIEIINNDLGQPILNLIQKKKKMIKNYSINISLSDENEYAIAFVVISLILNN